MSIPNGYVLCDECCLPYPEDIEDHGCLGQGHGILYNFDELVIDKSHLAENQ